MTVGNRIKQRRLELGLTQTELAERMGYSGKSSVCAAETGGDNITTTKVRKFAKALGVSFRYLMGLDNEDRAVAVTEPSEVMIAFPPKYDFEDDLDEESIEFAHLFQDADKEDRDIVMGFLRKKQSKS